MTRAILIPSGKTPICNEMLKICSRGICAFIIFVFKYEENRQVITQVINYQPAMYV